VCARANPRSKDSSRGAITGGERRRPIGRGRDAGARALRAVFSSNDNWLSLSEAERDEWRGYFDRMLEWLQHFGYTPERNPSPMLLEGLTAAAASADEGAP
jgi:hypothetical protein